MYRFKKWISLIAFFVFLISVSLTAHAEQPDTALAKPTVSAQAALLFEPTSGSVLFEQSADKQLPMASTTKIMTALLAVEYAEANQNPIVTITEEMVAVEGSSMGLRAGYQLSVLDIAGGMMMSSGNDAANSLALFIGKTKENFANLMNDRAATIGMKNTHFVTPSGLDDEQHYTTAYDMALLGAEAMNNATFFSIVSSSALKVNFAEPQQTIRYQNHNKLLKMYDNCLGIKTGYTKKSGRCLVSAAKKDGVMLIAVTLNAPNDWNDHSSLFDYGFSQVEPVSFDETTFRTQIPVIGGTDEILWVSGGTLATALPKDSTSTLNKVICLPKFVYAPVEAGDQVGSIEYYKGEQKVASVPILADTSVAYAEKQTLWQKWFG
ncbi:D-alanyl-D-alanine carboxypeptidase family protein [Scatolibacter rhodanostii]|uniref:D-alanyl-D-alanine carboxypeptidase family protein n=1 Tax=Scatolibacter rhodanostii TaxID=2014781 RepID=UPI000C0818F4|nr:D-alanyl-D-alanine carboxypeptidase family protein [Scatolibacter rhodanostii]